MKKSILSAFIILLCGYFVQGQDKTFQLKQSHASGIYKKGEKIIVYAFVTSPEPDSIKVTVLLNNNQLVYMKSFLPVGDSILIYQGKAGKPSSLILEDSMKEQKKAIGMIIDTQKLKPGTKAPKDLDTYWELERKNLKDLKLDVKFGKNESKDYASVCFDAEINCTGLKPARGYFAKPFKAAPKSLPIVLLVHAAGVKGEWCKSKAEDALRYAKMGKGAICFDLNAHGMLDGQPDEYYAQLETGELKEYYVQGLESKDDFYFRGMYLRLMRTIDFLTKLPEWDGKRIIVIGESQGGGQALAAAGLDPRVSAVVATVPAMCDWGGTLTGRKGGWPQPFEHQADKNKMKKTLPYFDTAHLLKNSKATIVVEIGLIDQTCPSTSIYAAVNQSKGKVIIYPVPYREHAWPAAAERPDWDKNVAGPKSTFIENYLQ